MAKVFARLNLTTQAAVKDIPADCRAAIEKHFPEGMRGFTKTLYNLIKMDLNKLTPEVKTFKRLNQAEIDKVTENGGALLISFIYKDQEGVILITKSKVYLYMNNFKENIVAIKNKLFEITNKSKNVIQLINQPETVYKAWSLTFPEGSSTMDLRDQRRENKKGAIFRTPKELQQWMFTYDKNGYRIDKSKYKEMLEQLHNVNGFWVKKIDPLMQEFLDIQKKAVDAGKLGNIKKDLDFTNEGINDAIARSLDSSYTDKEKQFRFDRAVKRLKELRRAAKDEGIL